MPTLAAQIELACLLEAASRKPGNVHPAASFADLTFQDFVTAAAVSAAPLATAGEQGLGRAILDAVRATRTNCGSNVNLGICLMMAPIAAVTDSATLRQDIGRILEQTTIADAALTYEAINLAAAGGLGTVNDQDVSEAPTVTLFEAMKMAADHDAIAYEWSTHFRGLDRDVVGWLRQYWQTAQETRHHEHAFPGAAPPTTWELAIIATHIELIAQGDTLIRRKCGDDVYQESKQRAHSVLQAGAWQTPEGWQQIRELDVWLRADGRRRNPGTSADLLAAGLFWGIRKGWIAPPSREAVLAHARQIAAE